GPYTYIFTGHIPQQEGHPRDQAPAVRGGEADQVFHKRQRHTGRPQPMPGQRPYKTSIYKGSSDRPFARQQGNQKQYFRCHKTLRPERLARVTEVKMIRNKGRIRRLAAVFAVVFAVISLTATVTYAADPTAVNVIYEETTTHTITKGVTLDNIVRFTKSGWYN